MVLRSINNAYIISIHKESYAFIKSLELIQPQSCSARYNFIFETLIIIKTRV